MPSTGTCFGVDVREQGVLKKHFDLAGQLSLRKLLTTFGPAVTYSTGGNFVHVRAGNGTRDWLYVVMPSFKTAEAPPEIVNSQLFDWLHAQANPGEGTLGSISTSARPEMVRAFEVKNAALHAVLTAIVTNTGGGGMWFTAGPHPAQQPFPNQPFWTILVYSEPRELNEFRLRRAIGAPK